MATDTAVSSRLPARPDASERLWQVPLFVIGVAAFIGTYQGWLPLHDRTNTFQNDLGKLTQTIGKPNPDLNELKAYLAQVASGVGSYPDRAPQANFTLGSGYVCLAELTADPSEAVNYWTLAKQRFDEVQAEQLDANDGPRLAYRAAKARAAIAPANTPSAELDLTRRLLLTPPMGEDPGEGHRLAAEISLRMVPPDMQQAKTSMVNYIAETRLATPPASIARAKLKASEIFRQLGEINEAKKWLSQIGSEAPPDVLSTTKAQLARIRMDEGDFAGASREWQTLILLPSLPANLKPSATYYLGICLLSLKPPFTVEATKRFEEATKFDGVEGAAAAVKLAELRLRSDESAKRKEAAGLLAQAVKGIGGPSEYPSNAPLLLNEVQATFESAVQVLTTDGAYEAAVAVADSYKSVAAAGRDREKRAETLAVWGATLQKAGGDFAPKYVAAADDYVALAKLRMVDTDQADLYRKAAALYRQAKDLNAAIGVYEQIIKLPKLPSEIAGPIGIEFAETLLSLDRPEEALKRFQEVMLTMGPAANAARYRVGRFMIDSRVPPKVAFGIALMDQFATSESIQPGEQDMHERALVDVAHTFIQKGQFAEAESRLEKQVKLYPTGVEAGLGKLLLGVCLLQRADPRANPQAANPVKIREEALRNFKLVVAEVDERKKADKPTERDPWLRTQANLRVLQTYQQMAKPYDVLTESDKLQRDFEGTVDELIVLSLKYHAYKQLDKPEGMFTIHAQMRDVFEKLKLVKDAFWAKDGEYSRKYWEEVWFKPDAAKKP